MVTSSYPLPTHPHRANATTATSEQGGSDTPCLLQSPPPHANTPCHLTAGSGIPRPPGRHEPVPHRSVSLVNPDDYSDLTRQTHRPPSTVPAYSDAHLLTAER